MPDWDAVVREKLAPCQVKMNDFDSVVMELAGHLDEAYQSALLRGIDENEARKLALQQVRDWRVLMTNIKRAKEGPVNHRTKTLWLPALITLLGASVSLAATQMLRMQPRVFWVGGWGLTFYWQWLATLPLFGAAGTYISRRGKGSVSARFAAGLSPALIMLVVMSMILPFGLAIDGFYFWRLVGFGLGLINWVAIPAVALLLGVLPFLSRPSAALPNAAE